MEAGPWGQTSWDALRALHAYAAEIHDGGDPGSFWTWCGQSKHPFAWRATPKKLSMTNSDNVKNNEKLRRKRVLPVSKDVDASGELFMDVTVQVLLGLAA